MTDVPGPPVPESPLVETGHGLIPTAESGWFVLNARDAAWFERPGRGLLCEFESFDGPLSFPQLGLNLTVLMPGEPSSMYHWEADQEDFLVLAGEAVCVVEGEQRPLRRWDLLHCPAGTRHVIVGAGSGPCLLLSVGARGQSTGEDWGAYPVDAAAQRLGAGVDRETTSPPEAYARFPGRRPAQPPLDSLPD